jgi:hypothetical protein
MPVLLFLPGYVIAHVVNLCDFRHRPLGDRILWSIALSFGTVPLLLYLAERVANPLAALGVLLLLAGTGLFLFARGSTSMPKYSWKKPAIFTSAWIAFVLLELLDLPWRGRLYVSGTVLDHGYRVAFIESLARTGIPAFNPLYFPGSSQPLHYYYGWYVLCALPVKFLHLDARCVLIASCIAGGLGLACMVALFLREFLMMRSAQSIGLALLAVTGLDVLPVLANLAMGVPLDVDPEWWSKDQVASWVDTALWVPHHTAGLIASLVAILLLWKSGESTTLRGRLSCAVFAGASLACCFCLSIYLGVATALLLVAWMIWLLLAEKDRRTASNILAASLIAVIFSIPFLLELHATASHDGSSSHIPLTLGVRQMVQVDLPNGLSGLVLRILLLFPGYFVELGVFGVTFLLLLRSMRRAEFQRRDPVRTALFFSVTGLIVSTLLRSTAIQNNDFGYRSILLPQFFLLLLTAMLIDGWQKQGSRWGWRSRVFVTMLAIGAISTLFQAGILRTYFMLKPTSAQRTYAMRQAYDALQRQVRADDVVQWEPSPELITQLQSERIEHNLHLLNARHQTAATDLDCSASFGGDAASCPRLQADLAALFEGGDRIFAQQVCHRWGIQYLVATSENRTWTHPASWPWTLPAVIVRPTVRILRCDAN